MALELSFRKLAMVLWSGTKPFKSHISSMLIAFFLKVSGGTHAIEITVNKEFE
jgi:hypothetical protein